MNFALWVIAGLLAAIFLASGAMKLAQSKERLVGSGMAALEDYGPGTIKALAVLEVLGAAGLILPAVFGVAPVLVPIAAVGLALFAMGLVVVHSRRREAQGAVTAVVLLALAVVVAWGRFGAYAFTA